MSRDSHTMTNLIMASDLSQRMRSALEFGAAIALLMTLTVMGVSRFQTYVIQSQIAEAFSLSSTVRGEMVAHRAERGDWPRTVTELANGTLAEESYLGAYVDHLELGQGGALTAVFSDDTPAMRLQERRLTFRPLTLPTHPSAPVSWVCGPHRYPEGLTPGGTDATNIVPSDLPSACRSY